MGGDINLIKTLSVSYYRKGEDRQALAEDGVSTGMRNIFDGIEQLACS